MQLDKNALEKMLSLDDDNLSKAISAVAAQAGISLKSEAINPSELSKIRAALSNATDKDIALANKQLSKYQKSNRGESQ